MSVIRIRWFTAAHRDSSDLIAFFSFRFFIRLVEGHPIPFALNYSFGHLCQLCASTFLCGPKRQCQRMFDETRRHTSIVYLSCLGLTLLIVFLPIPRSPKLILLILCMLVQFAASVWYTLSYIPYGRRTFLRLMFRTLGIDDPTPPAATTMMPFRNLQLT
jgi:Got1/Sft2-like family